MANRFKGLHPRSAALRSVANPHLSQFPEPMRLAFANPELALNELDRYESELRFKPFVRMMWPILEPGRRLVDGWLLDALCDHYEAVNAGHIKKLLINVPPGCMKSILAALFTAWQWGPQNKPHLRYVATSYAEKLSIRDNVRARDVVTSDLYQWAWGDRVTIDRANNNKGMFRTTKKGWRFATSVGGVGTGERGDGILVDDPHNIKKVESVSDREGALQYFSEVLPTRVNDPENAWFIVIMQRSHEGDISGHILGMELGYEHLCLPMEFEHSHPHKSRTSLHFVDPRQTDGELIWPGRFTQRYLDEDLKPSLRSFGGEYAEVGQLQQRPVARGGNMFKRGWWRYYETELTGHRIRPSGANQDRAVELPASFDRVVVSVDAAFKAVITGSRVCIGVVGIKGPNRYILECVVDFMEFDETCDALASFEHQGDCPDECRKLKSCPRPESRNIVGGVLSRWFGKETLIEAKANGDAIVRTLGQKIAGLIPITPQGGKESRAQAMQPSVRAGNYYLPDGAPWVIDFVANFASFPAGRFDDEVDMVSQAHIYTMGSHDATRAAMMGRL